MEYQKRKVLILGLFLFIYWYINKRVFISLNKRGAVMYIINSNLKFRGLSYGNNPKMIILHHAEASSCSIQDINSWHLNNGWSSCGYNYFIKKDGSIYKGRPDNAIGAHCLSYNSVSIGICMEGKFNVERMGGNQYNSLKELIPYLQNKYNINKIYGHRELNQTDCPGRNFPLHRIKKEYLGRNTSAEEQSIKEINEVIRNNKRLITRETGRNGYWIITLNKNANLNKN